MFSKKVAGAAPPPVGPPAFFLSPAAPPGLPSVCPATLARPPEEECSLSLPSAVLLPLLLAPSSFDLSPRLVQVGRRHPSRDASPRCHRTCSFPASGDPNAIP